MSALPPGIPRPSQHVSQNVLTTLAVDVEENNASCAVRIPRTLSLAVVTMKRICARPVPRTHVMACTGQNPCNVSGRNPSRHAWKKSCTGCGGEQCQLCRQDATRVATCCDDHWHSVDPPQMCKDAKAEAVSSCVDSKCRGCGGEQCQLCRQDPQVLDQCCTGGHAHSHV